MSREALNAASSAAFTLGETPMPPWGPSPLRSRFGLISRTWVFSSSGDSLNRLRIACTTSLSASAKSRSSESTSRAPHSAAVRAASALFLLAEEAAEHVLAEPAAEAAEPAEQRLERRSLPRAELLVVLAAHVQRPALSVLDDRHPHDRGPAVVDVTKPSLYLVAFRHCPDRLSTPAAARGRPGCGSPAGAPPRSAGAGRARPAALRRRGSRRRSRWRWRWRR